MIPDLVPWQGVNKEKSKPKEDSERPVQTECKVNIAYCLWELSVCFIGCVRLKCYSFIMLVNFYFVNTILSPNLHF